MNWQANGLGKWFGSSLKSAIKGGGKKGGSRQTKIARKKRIGWEKDKKAQGHRREGGEIVCRTVDKPKRVIEIA